MHSKTSAFIAKKIWLLTLAFPLFASLDQSFQTNIDSSQNTKISQEKIDVLSDKERDLFLAYREQLREIETLKTYNEQLKSVIKTQEDEMQSLNMQIVEIEVTQQRIMPLMQKMISSLNEFTELDTPFLKEERESRKERLNSLLSKANLTVSQKYRSIVEAYDIEMEYGRTIEAYEAALEDKTSVHYLRIGRTALYYLTRDDEEMGIYNPNTKKFEKLNSSYLREIKKGIKIARKQLAPELLRLPVVVTKGEK